MAKIKLLWLLVIVLLIANTVTLAMFWWGNKPTQPNNPSRLKDFLTQQLQLDSNQQRQYEVLVTAHRAAADPLRKQIGALKDSSFQLLKQGAVTDAAKEAATAKIAATTQQLELLHLNHFIQVRNLCTPAQQQKFDSLLADITRMLSMPPPGPRGPGGQGQDRRQGPPQGPPPEGREDRPGPPPEGPPPTDGPPPSNGNHKPY